LYDSEKNYFELSATDRYASNILVPRE